MEKSELGLGPVRFPVQTGLKGFFSRIFDSTSYHCNHYLANMCPILEFLTHRRIKSKTIY